MGVLSYGVHNNGITMFKWLKSLFTRKKVTIDSLVAGCKGNLASLSFDIGKAVLYRKDREGEGDFTKPQMVLDRGYGDCDDYAYIWMKCLDKMGIKNHIYACLRDDKKNHAIVIFMKDGYWAYTSNDEYYKTNLNGDKDEFLKFAYPKAERYEIVV